MRKRRLQATPPSEGNKRAIERLTQVIIPPVRLALEAIAPLRRVGIEHVPEGPALVLSNHVSAPDPMFIIAAAARPVHFLATAAALDEPLMGRVLQAWGSVPKHKFTVDPTSIRMLMRWAKLGAMVGSFPEGERSWDGQLLPLVHGIESLVRLLKIPVLPVRIINADRVMPRWAEVRRFGAVVVEFGRPRSFARDTPVAEIREWIESALRIDPDDEHGRAPVRGRSLARGLDNPLYRCPQCFAWDALSTADDDVGCDRCGASWRVDTCNRLIANNNNARATSMTIIEARARLRARNLDSYVVDERRFEREGIVAISEPMRLLDHVGRSLVELGHGRLELRADVLRCVDAWGFELLHQPLTEIHHATIELRRRLTFRNKQGEVIEAVLPRESPLKWAELVEHWRVLAG